MKRSSGILLHPTSLPGRYGVGELGSEAVGFLDFLSGAGQTLWQVLPLGPIGEGNSPYQSYSAMAGNPLLISLDRLAERGLLDRDLLARAPELDPARVDYPAAIGFKERALRAAYARFRPSAAYERFCQEQSDWLDDYALFMALKESHDGAPWHEWEPEMVARSRAALNRARGGLAERIEYHRFVQYLFSRQYEDVRRQASSRGIRIVGDVPIFVAHDSADVWAHPDLFQLDALGRPTVVAGVPPDYFSATGQLWGNPLYRWDVMARDGYAWWVRRLRMATALYDLVRLDHFRGFEAYWEVPAADTTARRGRWVKGPGAAFFESVRRQLGGMPFIAEDLGVITPEVEELRDRFGLPGMKVLQFAFSDPASPYLPHNYTRNCVVYTGTHDNDTTLGWWDTLGRNERSFVHRYLGRKTRDVAWDMIRLAMSSVAEMAIVPLQDVLRLGSDARMNLPGTESGNWEWRYKPGALTSELREELRTLTRTYGR